jgi:hypothetical protein
MNGVRHYLWWAVDQNGVVIDILVQPRRDRLAAMRFFRKPLRANGYRRPNMIVTDKLRSYGAAKRVVMPSVAYRQHRDLNNRAEEAPSRGIQLTRRRVVLAGCYIANPDTAHSEPEYSLRGSSQKLRLRDRRIVGIACRRVPNQQQVD